MVRCIQPQPGETIQDPAAGTAGFLIAADSYIKDKTDDLSDLTAKTTEIPAQQGLYRHRAGAQHPSSRLDELPATRHGRG